MDLTTTKDFAFRIKNENQVLSDMIDTFMSTNLMVNDFTEGSITRSLMESVSIEIEQLYYLTIENMTKAIETGVQSAFGFETQDATYAYGNLIIGFKNPLNRDMILPKGTIFYSSDKNYSQQFRTQVPYKIAKGTLNAEIEVYCTEKGTVGNVPSGTIDTSMGVNGYALITQNEAFNTGRDKETYDQSQERFRKMIASLAHGTRNSIEYAINSIPEVDSCYIYEDNYGEVIIYVCDANGNLPDSLRQKVVQMAALYKVAGVRYVVRPVHTSWASLNIEVDVDSTLLTNGQFLKYVKDNIESYVNHFKIGQPLFKNDIIQHVMDIDDLDITDCNVGIQMSTDEQLSTDKYVSDGSPSFVGNTEVNQSQLVDPNIYQKGLYGMIGLPNYKIDDNSVPTWESVIVPNKVLNAGFHKDFTDDWDTNLGGHDIANIDDSVKYGNSNSLALNIEDNGRFVYRYVESNKIPVEANDIYSVRSNIKAVGLQDSGFMLPILFQDYDAQKGMEPIPMKPANANYNLLPGTSSKQTLAMTNLYGSTMFDSNISGLDVGYVDEGHNPTGNCDVSTPYFPIEGNTYYTIKFTGQYPTTGVSRVVWYDDNQNAIGRAEVSNLDPNTEWKLPVSPYNAKYARVCRYTQFTSNLSLYRIQVFNSNMYGFYNTTTLSDDNKFTMVEPGLQNGAQYVYSMSTAGLPCSGHLHVRLRHNDGFKDVKFDSKVYPENYVGNMSVNFTVPADFGTVDSITLYFRTENYLDEYSTIPYIRLSDEKLEQGGSVTPWYLTQAESANKPLYIDTGSEVSGTSDEWVVTSAEGIVIPEGYDTLALRWYVESHGIMYIAQPQVNKSKSIAPFRINEDDDTPQYITPYTEYYPLEGSKYTTAPNEIIRCSNVTVSFNTKDVFQETEKKSVQQQLFEQGFLTEE